MLTLLLGRAGSGKTMRIVSEIAEAARLGCDKIYLVTPEQYSHTTERLLCEVGGNSVSKSAEVTSFRRLCSRVSAEAGGHAKKCLGEGERILLLYKALRGSSSALKTFVHASPPSDFISELLYSIDEFKSYSISPNLLAKLADEAPTLLRDKLRDLALIYAAYQGAFNQGELDSYDELDLLYDNIEKTGFFDGRTVYFDGFSGFTEQEYKIIGRVLSSATNATITLCADENATDGLEKQVFSKSRDTIKRITELANRSGCDITVRTLSGNHRAKTDTLKYIERSVFAAHPAVFEGKNERLTICGAENSFEECELAAGYIIKLVRDSGYRYRDICVTARNINDYSGDLEAVFERYGIPLYLNRNAPVLDKPVIALITSAIACINDGFKYDSVLAYIKTGLTGIRRPDLDLLENYLYTWSVRGSMWTREKGFTMNPSGEDGPLTAENKKTLVHINRIRDKIRTPLINLRSALKADRTGAGSARALYNYLNEIDLPRRLAAQSRLFTLRKMPAQAAEYRALWDILLSIIDSLGIALKDYELEAGELINLISLLAAQYDIGLIPVALDRVNVSQFERIGEGRVRALIVLGATDDAIPRCSDAQGLLTDSERESLNELGLRLNPGASARMDEEFRLLYLSFSAPSEALYISYPGADLSGASLRKSIAVIRLEKLISHPESYDISDARAQSVTPCFDMLAANAGGGLSSAADYFKKDKHYSELLKLAERNSKIPRGPISEKSNIAAVFGKRIILSASRADKFSSCRYAYFLQYGLRANPRRVKSLDAPEIGTFIHDVLEKTLRRINELGGFNKVDKAQALSLSLAAVNEFATEKLNNFTDKTPRFIYLFKRLIKIIETVVGNLYDEFSSSRFAPLDFELKFSDKNGDIPALRITGKDFDVALEGYVDRVDGYERDGVLYVRVIDYKTGKKAFSLNEVVNGIGMQMLLYLFALEKHGERRYGKPVVPAGVLYVPVSDGRLSYVADETTESAQERRDKEMLRKGVLLHDLDILCAMDENIEKNRASRFFNVSINKNGELSKTSIVESSDVFQKLAEHVNKTLSDIGAELANGIIEANPYYKSNYSSCDYCEYSSVCGFDEINGADRKRPLIKLKFSDFIDTGGKDE